MIRGTYAAMRDRLVAGGWLHHPCCRCQRDRPGHVPECEWQQVWLCRACRRDIAPGAHGRARVVLDWVMGARPHQVARRMRKRGWQA